MLPYPAFHLRLIYDSFHYPDKIFIRFGSKLWRQFVGIPMGTICAPLFADLFLFCDERDFMMFFLTIIKLMLLALLTLPQDIQMGNPYFLQMVNFS